MPEARNFIKRETLAQLFSYEFCDIFKKTFFTDYQRIIFSEYLSDYLSDSR